ncbi:MAG: LamG-like jellyroll fold domain-containing protein, partial [Planctomycetota bacterium]
WKQFQGKNENLMTVGGKQWHLGIDPEHLGAIGADAVGGYVWTEWGVPTINTPYPAEIRGFDAERGGIAFAGPWNDNPGGMIFKGHRYYLEDRPQWLDEPGEFWFDKQGAAEGAGGTLYVRLPGDRDPDSVRIEAAKRLHAIDATDVGSLRVSGLAFRFTDVLWDLDAKQYDEERVHAGVIRLRGSAERVVVDHCRFEHIHQALRVEAGSTIPYAAFTDNEVRFADHGGSVFKDSVRHQVTARGQSGSTQGALTEVVVLRNRMHHIGFRHSRGGYGAGIEVHCAQLQHIAGNIIDRCAEQGIDVYGGKHNGDTHDAPLSRVLIHHNRVEDSLLASSDWGGIEVWQGGPFYVYSNISRNPGGIMNWKTDRSSGTPRFGFSFYTDGASKAYHFNNIAAGKDNEPGSLHANNSAFQSLIGFGNVAFHNTIYRFVNGIRRQGTGGSRQMKYLANVFQDISEYALLHHVGKDDPNVSHFNNLEGYDFRAMAYARNVIDPPGAGLGKIDETGTVYEDIDTMAARLAEFGTPAASVGVVEADPLRDPAGGDFRPRSDSAAVDFGARVFVPWSLAATVGEWHFIPTSADPGFVEDEHWYLSEELVDRNVYQQGPRYPLRAHGVTAASYVDGDLEDWAPGALALDGSSVFLRVAHADMAAPYTIPLGKKGARKHADQVRTLGLEEKQTMDIQEQDLLIEVHLRVRADGIVVRKRAADVGYSLDIIDGAPVIALQNAEGATLSLRGPHIADGAWHHLIAECDRDQGLRLHVDGATVGAAGALGGSLSNPGDFLVGGSPDGEHLTGAIDFLRICRSTLAASRTDLAELRAWQFDGPPLRDLTGRLRGDAPDAGALELAD